MSEGGFWDNLNDGIQREFGVDWGRVQYCFWPRVVMALCLWICYVQADQETYLPYKEQTWLIPGIWFLCFGLCVVVSAINKARWEIERLRLAVEAKSRQETIEIDIAKTVAAMDKEHPIKRDPPEFQHFPNG